jgi:acyl carrier protein
MVVDDIDLRLISVFRSVFRALSQLDDGEVIALGRRDLEGWDSGAHLLLLTCLEEEFGIAIPNAAALAIDSYSAARGAVAS